MDQPPTGARPRHCSLETDGALGVLLRLRSDHHRLRESPLRAVYLLRLLVMERELLIGGTVSDASRERNTLRQTPGEQRREIRKFAWRALLFAAPLLLLVIALEFSLWHVGETWPLERVIHFQETHPRAYFGRLFLDQGTFRYKYLQILRRRPEILVLGSSRTMQFRAEMFGGQAASFYNAGGMIHSIGDIDQFLDLLPQDATPRMVIIGLDFWWLNADFPRLRVNSFATDAKEDGTYRWQGHASVLSEFARNPGLFLDLVTHGFGKKRNVNAIGALALFRQSGFRIDGSKRFDLRIPRTPEALCPWWPSRMDSRLRGNDVVVGVTPSLR